MYKILYITSRLKLIEKVCFIYIIWRNETKNTSRITLIEKVSFIYVIWRNETIKKMLFFSVPLYLKQGYFASDCIVLD